jgi:hypothetical protein
MRRQPGADADPRGFPDALPQRRAGPRHAGRPVEHRGGRGQHGDAAAHGVRRGGTPWRTQSIGPAMVHNRFNGLARVGSTGPEMLTVESDFDAEGLVTEVRRWYRHEGESIRR